MKTANLCLVRIPIVLVLLLQLTPTKAVAAGPAFALPAGRARDAYEFAIRTEGGQPPFRWSVVEGELPPGVELHPSGSLLGTPTSARSRAYEFTLQVSNSSQPPQAYTQSFALVVTPAPLRIVLNAGNRLTIVSPTNAGTRAAAPANAGGSGQTPTSSLRLDSAIISGVPKAGNETVKGFIAPRAEKVVVEVYSDLASGRDSLINRVTVKAIDINTGEFTEKVPALKANQRVRVVGLLNEGGRQTPLISDEVTVAAAEPAPPPALKKPLLEGVRSVSGIALPDPAGGKPTKVRVEIYNGPELAQVGETDDIKNTGDFTVTLEDPLEIGQIVTAKSFVGATAGVRTTDEDNNQVEAVADWGRARATFAFGAVFSQERDDFSKSDPYLDFNLDWNWHRRMAQDHNFTYLFNTFFQTRLTSIPVDPAKQEKADETDPPKCDPTKPDDFFCSKKAATVQIGAYLPLYLNDWMTWKHRGDRNALFVAPIIKAGMHTLTGDGDEDRNLMTFYSGGLRLGHYNTGKYTKPASLPREAAPRLISYLDVTFGKWQNLEFKGERRPAHGI